MKKTQCINKHFFDSDTFDVCPLCGAEPIHSDGSEAKSSAEPVSKSKFKFFSGQKHGTTQNGQHAVKPETHHTENGLDPVPPTIKQNAEEIASAAEKKAGSGLMEQVKMVKTRSLFNQNKSEHKQEAAPVAAESAPLKQPSVYSETVSSAAAAPVPAHTESNSDKTVGYYNGGGTQSEAVVGWLVCLKGVNVGKSYELYARKNTVGRLYGNDVVLENEAQVSRESHIFVEFEHKKSDFYLLPSNGSSPYVNDEVIHAAYKLKKYDKIEVGGCILLFVPLCGEDFSWNDYIDKE